jgi:MFS family permease
MYLSIVQMTMEAFSEKFSMAIGVILIAGFTGGVVANAPLIAVEQHIGWQNALKIVAIALAIVYTVWCAFSVGVTPSEKEASGKFGSLKDVIFKKGNWYICVFNWVNFGLFYVVQTVIGKKYLEDFANLTPSRAALVFSVTGAIAAFSGVTQAYLSDLCGGRKAMFCRIATLVSFTVLAGQVTMLALGRGSWLCAALFCLLAATATMSALTIPLLRNINSGSNFGLAVGLMNFGNYLAVAVFGDLAGFLIGLYPATVVNGTKVYGVSSYITLFAVLILFLLPAMLCAWLISDKNKINDDTEGQKA